MAATVLFPEATPPVSPTRVVMGPIIPVDREELLRPLRLQLRLAVDTSLLLGAFANLAQELLVALRTGRGDPAGTVVLRELRQRSLVGRQAPASVRATRCNPRDRSREREEEHDHQPPDLRQVPDLTLRRADDLDQAEDPEGHHDEAREQFHADHGRSVTHPQAPCPMVA
jgi:hypothetical protein